MDTQHPRKSGKTIRNSTLAVALVAGTALGSFAMGHSAFAQNSMNGQSQNGNNSQNSNNSQNGNNSENGNPVNPEGAKVQPHAIPDFTNLVSQVKPAVVSITNRLKSTPADFNNGQSQQMPELPFPFSQMIPQHPHVQAVEARGSGFIISADGYVVTNNHVVKDERTLSVTLDDGTVLPAKVVGTDPRTDIALLKINAHHKLPFIQLGNSRNVKPGEWVVAMGNPFGLGGTVTAGIVSAVSRDIGAGPYDQFIQVDAPINQGNSGGPLFTQDGKVIGMNTAIISPSGGSVGIGFAIPSDMIRTVTNQLMESGHVTRGFVGVEAQQITPTMAEAMHLRRDQGALLAGVQPESPASRAGLQPGDVIETVDGTKISNPRELAVQIAQIKPGNEAHLKVLHDGQTKNIDVKVEQMPSEQTASSSQNMGTEQHGRIGLALAPLSPDLRNQLDVPDGTKGAVVRAVQPGSPADTAGLQPGDVIVGVGNHPVNSPTEAVRAMRQESNSKAVALRVIRNGQPIFVGVNLNPDHQG